jgi:hypothetical protein
MLTFKQYINEKWSGERGGYRTHHGIVDGHKVTTKFSPQHSIDNKGKHGGWHAVDFYVNHSLNDGEVKDSKTKVKIMHHVHKVISHFIEKKRPKSLSMSGNSDKKRNLYAHVAQRIAKKHGGEVEHDVTDTYIEFPKNKT